MSILNEIKQLITQYKTAKKNARFSGYKLKIVNTTQLCLQNMPKIRLQICYNNFSHKVSVIVNSKSVCSTKEIKNSITYKKALK